MPNAQEIRPKSIMVMSTITLYTFDTESMKRLVNHVLSYVKELEIFRTQDGNLQLSLEYNDDMGFADILGPDFTTVLSRLPLKEHGCFYAGTDEEVLIAAALARFIMTPSMHKLTLHGIGTGDFSFVEHIGSPCPEPLMASHFHETELSPWRQEK